MDAPFPIVDAIEKRAVASWRGQLRFRHVGWIAEDNRSPNGGGGGAGGSQLFGASEAYVEPAVSEAMPGVSSTPGFEHTRGDAMRMSLWLEAHESRCLGSAIERGFWDEGFVSGFNSRRAHWTAYESAIEVPHAALALVAAILPALWCRRIISARRRAWRIARGLCASCGYDLRSSHERCPECGSAISLRDDSRVLS
jgi:hypothetical protein